MCPDCSFKRHPQSLNSATITSDHVRYGLGPGTQHPLSDMPADHSETTQQAKTRVEAVVPPEGVIPQSMAGNQEAPDPGVTQSDPEQGAEQPNPNLESPFTRWSSTLLGIAKSIEQLAKVSSLEKVACLGQVCVLCGNQRQKTDTLIPEH
jgi:hypothetical protein